MNCGAGIYTVSIRTLEGPGYEFHLMLKV